VPTKQETFINVDTYNILMYLEKRKAGKSIKYYLVHSYREKGIIKKIRKYLGQDLSQKDLQEIKFKAEKQILSILEEINTKVFLFMLTKSQIQKLNKADKKIRIAHLDEKDWQKFTEDFVYNTNAIEGSTVKREEVPKILRNAKTTDDEELETKGVARAVDYIRETKEEISLSLIKKLHYLCFQDTKSFAGKIRDVEVVIRNARGEILHQGVKSSEVNAALNDLTNWYKANKEKFKPLILAAIIHNQFEYIHPFQDGNGRVGRLLLNFILIKKRYPPINITFEDRGEYYNTLQEYQKNHDLKPTIQFLVKQYNKTLSKVPTK